MASNLKDGHGTYTHPNGYKYVGNWSQNKQNGKGFASYPNGQTQEGDWKWGKLHGHGKVVFADGYAFEGTFENHIRHGFGKTTYPDGSSFEATYVNGKKRESACFDSKGEKTPCIEDTTGTFFYLWAQNTLILAPFMYLIQFIASKIYAKTAIQK